MKIIAVIVARNGSTRVPGKSLIEFSGEPLIWHMIRIAKQIHGVSQVCLATSNLKIDDSLCNIAENENIEIYRGDPENVLDRVYNSSKELNADVVVYIGGDCPLLDPTIVSDAIDFFISSKIDYLNNYDPPTFPGGQDINIISFDALKKAYDNALAPSQRIHAFSYLTFHSNEFKIRNYNNTNYKNDELDMYHWSLDYKEDVGFISKVYKKLYEKSKFIKLDEVLNLIESNPEISKLNINLMKPRVKHSLFSSPGIMKDINNDILYLNKLAIKSVLKEDFKKAEKYYYEISAISKKLSNIS